MGYPFFIGGLQMAIEEEKVQAVIESDSEQFKQDLESVQSQIDKNAERTAKANKKIEESSKKSSKGIMGLFNGIKSNKRQYR